jgi:uncharacterized protein involved in exopolysaccharide biosynthesis
MKIPQTKMLGLALLLAGLALGGAGLWLLLKPAQFAATARIWTESQPVNAGPDYSYDPYFIQIEFEILQSQLVLGTVVTNLNLNEVWGKKFSHGSPLKTFESIAIIKNHLRLAPVRGTKLIAITFQSDDRQEAAQVANAIAEAYQNYRITSRAESVARGLQLLQQQYRDEMEKISAAQTNLDLLREKYQIKKGDDSDYIFSPNSTLSPAEFEAEQKEYDRIKPFWEAKRELIYMRQLHQLVFSKINAEELELQNPKTSLVQFTDRAEPPSSPVGPNRVLGAVLLGLGLFSLAGGILMLKPTRR